MPHFDLEYRVIELNLKETFTISRGSKDTVRNVLVRLKADEVEGLGEAAPNSRYDEDADKVIRFLDYLPDDFFDHIRSPFQVAIKIDRVAQRYRSETKVNPVQSARCAIEMAWLDWWAKKQERPLWKLWDHPSNKGPVTSFTIGLDEPDLMQRKVQEAAEYPILKVKLGTDSDRKIIHAIREVTDKPVRVDANEGWKSLDEAKAAIDFLAEQNIELVEQPMPADRFDALSKLKNYSPLPLCADESFTGTEALKHIAEAFDVINIKLMKTGSMVKARRIMDEAGLLGLDVMIGCMIESSLANTAGAILSLRAAYADLDGHLLIDDDPFEGLTLDDEKKVTVPDSPGLGVCAVT